jgi:hypothetical protein
VKEHRFSLNVPFNENMVCKPLRTGFSTVANVSFQLFAAHSIWNAAAIDQLIPSAHKITVLREPVSAFESFFMYAGYDKKHGNINDFAKRLRTG